MAEPSFESFTRDLQAVRARGDRFQQRARDAVEGEAMLPAALEELSTALEELRVAEEQVQAQREQLAEVHQSVEAERDHYWEHFELAPIAYLVTDRVGVIREANRQAARLLGVARRLLVGRTLAMFVTAQDRWGLRDWLSNRLGATEPSAWRLRLQSGRSEPVPVVVSTSVARDPAGEVAGVRWALQELPPAGERAAQEPTTAADGTMPTMLAELVSSRPPADRVVTATPSSASDWDKLAGSLQRVMQTALPLLRAERAGMMMADPDGVLHWVTGTDQAEQTFGYAQRDLGEGPCIDAFTTREVVWSRDLWTDPRWPRLGPAARTNQVRGLLAAPVLKDGQPVGTCNALTFSPRDWSEIEVEAIGAYATMLAQLIGSASDARHKGELAAQLQFALDSRVVIEQAKGILMGRHGLDERAAFARLRQLARSSSRKLTEVARGVVSSRPT